MGFRSFLFLCFVALLTTGCREKTLFRRLDSGQTGVTFRNDITENDTFNVLSFEYIYNGGGVGIGDFNNDGRPDIFFAGNQVSSRLYLNQTAPDETLRFEDVTTAAGVETKVWCTGVAVADLNADGWADIYVSTIHPNYTDSTANLLFLNQGLGQDGIPRFVEAARQVGLADYSYATQAAFLDYDRDGDLDLYLLTNAIERFNRNNLVGPRHDGAGRSVDRLYRNLSVEGGGHRAKGKGHRGEGKGQGKYKYSIPHAPRPLPSAPHPLRFTNVSREAGLVSDGWGLGVAVSDVNRDGWPDVYAANDFQSNDHLYINRGDSVRKAGGPVFGDRILDYTRHTSHNSMGMDVADLNNDGLVDVGVVDMLPEDNLRQKTMFPGVNYDRYAQALRMGYGPQFVRNSLQINTGLLPDAGSGRGVAFADLGYLTGMQATDWSWSLLMADFDNDGWRDVLITNGYRKDVTDLDFVAYNRERHLFGRDEDNLAVLKKELATMKGVKKPNVAYRNTGPDLRFEDVSAKWGLADASYSNGTAYADFDGDGDLDLVMNNINDEAFIYQNQLIEQRTDQTTARFLRVRFDEPLTQGYGLKLWAYAGTQRWFAEYYPQKGYKSTQEAAIHLGLGSVQTLDSIRVEWPAGGRQTLRRIATSQTLTLAPPLRSPRPPEPPWPAPKPAPVFADVSKEFVYQHTEEEFVDFKYQLLLPHKHSEQGPRLATGDVNGDGLDDFVVGGSARQSAVAFMQQKNGRFRTVALPTKDAEDVGLALFDADGDGDLDLYGVSGSSEYLGQTKFYQDRLYRNDGQGHFRLDSTALPRITASGSVVTPADVDRDGDLDLFVGGRMMPGRYPETPRSYLLLNDGKGRFRDATPPNLAHIGMVTAAVWADLDRDQKPEWVLAGEFMPIVVLKGEGTRYTRQDIPQSTGWWNALTVADFDGDGDLDLVAGNLGLNSRYRASPEQPVSLYANDYDNNGTVDPLLTLFISGKEYLTHPRDNLTDQIPSIKRLIPKYAAYGEKTFAEVLSPELRRDVRPLKANEMRSLSLENQGGGQFRIHPLPTPAQWAPLTGLLVQDVNADGHPDLVGVGNQYGTEVLTGRYDAGIGTVLLGDGRGGFWWWPNPQHGFVVDGDARDVAMIRLGNGKRLFVATQNRGPLRAYVVGR